VTIVLLQPLELGMDKPEKYQRQRAKKRIYVDSNQGGLADA
jgi:hypothetical protein